MPKPFQRQLFAEGQATAAPSNGNEPIEVKLWCVDNTRPKSVYMSKVADDVSPASCVWIPRSLMGDRISKFRDPGCQLWRWEFTLPAWKARELGLDKA